MSPIVIQNCTCDKKRKIYVSITREAYFNQRIAKEEWQLEYSKKVKEEKYRFYKENFISSGDECVEYDDKPIKCEKCGKLVHI